MNAIRYPVSIAPCGDNDWKVVDSEGRLVAVCPSQLHAAAVMGGMNYQYTHYISKLP